MSEIDKRSLTERDICTKFVHPALESSGWDMLRQIREQFYFTDGQVIVRGKTVKRGERQFADYLLFYKPNIPLAIIEAKDNTHKVGDGMQQGLRYAEKLDIPFVFSTNGDGFIFHDRVTQAGPVEQELALDAFPPPRNSGNGCVPREAQPRRHSRLSHKTTTPTGASGPPAITR